MDIISKRNDKIAFMALSSDPDKFIRMRGFTEFSQNKNPIEYSRKYVDEQTERNDVVGYAPSISYSFDRFSDNAVHSELINITNSELVGDDAIRSIIIVNVSDSTEEKTAYKRNWSIIPDSEGNDNSAYTYSGTLKANGDIILGLALSDDDWQSCTFVANE